MAERIKIRQILTWLPEPVKKPDVEIRYEEGKILPNSPEEDVELPMLRATYSSRQLKSIRRRRNNLKFKNKKNRRALMKELQNEEDYL